MKVKARSVYLNTFHVIVVDSRGRVWERFADMPVGEWHLVPLPNEPKSAKARKLYKKR